MLKFTFTLASFIAALAASNSQELNTEKTPEETVLTVNLNNMITLAALTKVGAYVQ